MVYLCIKLFVISISTFTCTYAGSDLQRQQSPVVSIISSIAPGCYMANQNMSVLTSILGGCLQGQQFPSLTVIIFSAAFPLGGASIILGNPHAFGVFECPHLYWARKVFNFDPC